MERVQKPEIGKSIPEFSTTVSLPLKARESEIEMFSEKGEVISDENFIAYAEKKGEITITLSDHMPSGIYLIYSGKRNPLRKVRKK